MIGYKSEPIQGKLLNHALSFEKNGTQRARKRDCGKSYKKEEQMEAIVKEKEETSTKEVKTGWAKWGSRFYNFLVMGGFLVVLVVIVGIVMAISILCHKPEVTILSPKTNYVVKAGDSYEILWKTQLAESEFGAMVTLEFSKDDGKSWEKIEENVPNSGKYMWKVPKADSTQCKVRISSKSKPGRYRGTSAVFSVK